MSCLPDDIIESVISCETAKATWTDLVHSFEGPSDTKENRIMDLKLEYQTFTVKPTKSLSQTYTRYKTLLNELASDGVNFSKHEINVGFVNSLPENNYGVIYEDMLNGAYFGAKMKTFEDYLILTNTPYPGKEIRRISSNSSQKNAYKQFPIRRIPLPPYIDFQENFDDEIDERGIRRIGNCLYAFFCEELELIRRISFPGYGVLVRIKETVHKTNIDFMFREVNTITGKLIEQGLIAGVDMT
nr:retrovirus-related Pol polyprotein from transposon TNT 1-94 [Tanacetum cinerariifolium]